MAPTEKFVPSLRDHHRIEIRLQPFQSRVQHRDDLAADCVHFRVEFAAQHAVAQIDQARAGIFLHRFRLVLQRLQEQ